MNTYPIDLGGGRTAAIPSLVPIRPAIVPAAMTRVRPGNRICPAPGASMKTAIHATMPTTSGATSISAPRDGRPAITSWVMTRRSSSCCR